MIDARFFVTMFDGNPEMDIFPVSLFKCEVDSSSGKGTQPFTVKRGHGKIIMSFFCPSCEAPFEFQYRLKDLKAGSFIVCPHCHWELGFMGSLPEVQQRVRRHRQEVELLIKEMGFDNFFKDPFVIYDAINYIHDLAEDDKLRCECGSHDICAHLEYDKVELICKSCGSFIVINAAHREDTKSLRKKQHLVISSMHQRQRKY